MNRRLFSFFWFCKWFPNIQVGYLLLFIVLILPNRINASENDVTDCFYCHNNENQIIPLIAGQKKNYLINRLEYFRSIDQSNSIMARLMNSYTAEEVKTISIFLANMDSSFRPISSEDQSDGFQLYLKKCAECHEGQLHSPHIKGQTKNYIVKSLRDYLYSGRSMPEQMKNSILELTSSELESVISYLVKPLERDK